MQIIDTHVNDANDGMVTVEFQGEGGELVSVKMAAAGVQGEAAINRAKAVMVQLTTFAEDRDPSQVDWSHKREEGGEGASETKPDPIVLSLGDVPSPAGSAA